MRPQDISCYLNGPWANDFLLHVTKEEVLTRGAISEAMEARASLTLLCSRLIDCINMIQSNISQIVTREACVCL